MAAQNLDERASQYEVDVLKTRIFAALTLFVCNRRLHFLVVVGAVPRAYAKSMSFKQDRRRMGSAGRIVATAHPIWTGQAHGRAGE